MVFLNEISSYISILKDHLKYFRSIWENHEDV
jgi:hypothetical protein